MKIIRTKFQNYIKQILKNLHANINYETWIIIIISIVIGISGGLFSVLFRLMIGWSDTGFHELGEAIFGFLPDNWWIVFVPALAGLIVGPLIYFLAREAKGHGVPEVMEAVALKGGRMRMRVIFIKAIASASSIGAGASVGREGPIIQMGSGIGSVLSQWLKLKEDKIKTCIGCGAAAGIAATFNAPLAGVIFAQEIILNNFTPSTFIPVVVSSVTASVIAHALVGDIPAFIVSSNPLTHPFEIVLYVLLGILAALISVLFVKTLYKSEDIWDGAHFLPEWSRPVIGGLFIGLIGFKFPQVLGVGYETIEATISGELLMVTMFILVFTKIIATSITLGSGHSGGIFAPSLFIGSSLGGAFGVFMKQLLPNIVANPTAYAIAGMGAVVAGATQAPITAILIIFEMTRDYKIMLPLMIAVVFSTLLYSYLQTGSIYTLKLLRRGINLISGRDINIMKRIKVKDVMSTPVEFVRQSDKVGDVIKFMHDSKHNGFPVLNEKDELVGIITLENIRSVPVEGIMELPVTKLMSTKLVYTFPENTLDDAFKILNNNDIGHLPVVSPKNTKQLIGFITHSDLVKAYDKKLLPMEEGL
ncbi:MAG: chloride channel protein [Bacillota bacterium]